MAHIGNSLLCSISIQNHATQCFFFICCIFRRRLFCHPCQLAILIFLFVFLCLLRRFLVYIFSVLRGVPYAFYKISFTYKKKKVSTLKKGAQTISAYFQKAHGFSHLLAAVDKPIEGSEVVSHILAGLGAEYDPLVTFVTTRQDSIFLNDLYGYMLSYELCLEQHKSAMELNISIANMAQCQSPSYSRNNHGYNFGYRNNNFSCGRGPPQQFPSYSTSSSLRPTWQVCHKQDHTTATCWFRYEQSFQADSSPMHANTTSATSTSDPSWYPDTGANVHLTHDLPNLNLNTEEYIGIDQIHGGNGQGLHISHSGRGLLPTPSSNFNFFSLLHVPQIQKNLISVNQFTKDNHIFIEFHPNLIAAPPRLE
jgi:hypothetical protein